MRKKPGHILYIIADELRADCISPYGNSQVQTPALEELASDGIVYENAFCTFPVCTPSRYSMMTGLYAHQHRCVDNRSSIPADLDTLPGLLLENGYRTGAVGKLHCNPPRQKLGFEWSLLAEQCGEGRYEDDYHYYLMERGLCDVIDMTDQCEQWRRMAPGWYWEDFGNRPEDLPEGADSTSWIGENALKRIESWGEEGQFLMVSFIKPHHPFDAPCAWRERYDPEQLWLLPGWTDSVPKIDYERDHGYFDNGKLTADKQRQLLAAYYAAITQIDYWVGRMVETLKEKGIYEDTMIVFTADHGDYMGFHHMVLKCNHMYDPVMKVPLLIKYADGAEKNAKANVSAVRRTGRRSGLCCHPDLFATLLTECGIPLPEAVTGQSLEKMTGRSYIISQQIVFGKPEYMVRSESHKLIFSESGGMLFDLKEDPLELENRFWDAAYGAVRKQLQDALYAHLLFEAPAVPCHDRSAVYTVKALEEIESRKRFFDERMHG